MDRFEMQLQVTEIELLKVIGSHPYIIRLVDVLEDDKHFYIVLELLEGRDLFEFMNRNFMNESRGKRIMYAVLRAVKYLHTFGIVHRDLKLENLMMTTKDPNQALPKIIDFGLAKVFLPWERSQDKFGTIAYCPPEILLGNEHWSAADIWSLGVCMHVILTNRVPFVSLDKKQTVKNIVEQKLNFN
jgi:serine/threonine protein kinase